jgi:hypothetical protein
MVRGGRAEAPGPRRDVGFRRDQKTANFKVSKESREMQWSALTEEKQKNQLAANIVSLHKSNNNNKGGAITCSPPPLYQRCTATKDGKLQNDLS